MLGGGNPVGGANPVGTGTGLNYIGNHAYAYSGVKPTSGTATNFLDFTTSRSGYLVAKIQPVYIAQGTNNIQYIIKLDGQIINQTEVTSSRDYSPYDVLHLIVPPESRVEIAVDNLSSGTEDAAVVFTAEVFY
tara:strand:+ start:237 stop:635 length:399 start_codon:yes stop_codon:yes gene_type:complete